MTDTPIADLYRELGREDTDRVSLSYFNDTTPWQTRQIMLPLVDAFAAGLTERKLNVYLMVNTVDPDSAFTNGRGDAAQVNRLTALYADLDYKTLTPEKAKQVTNMLSAALNAVPTAIVHSGHGIQPYWPIEDGEITPLNRGYTQRLLRRWGRLVKRMAQITGGDADNVYDLPRVLRAPGTINWKDPDNPVESTLEHSEWAHPITITEADEAISSYGFADADEPEKDFTVVAHPSTWEPAEMDCAFVSQLLESIARGTTGARHPWMLSKAFIIEAAARNGCLTQETWKQLAVLLEVTFKKLLATPPQPRAMAPGEVASAMKFARSEVSTFDEVQIAQNLNYHGHKDYLQTRDAPKELSGSSPATTIQLPIPDGTGALQVREVRAIALSTLSFSHTDAANAERLAEKIVGKYTYVPGLGWHLWRNGRYVPDEANSITREAIARVRQYAEETPTGEKWAQQSMAAPRIAASIALAESIPEMVTMPIQLDAEPLELCTPSGVVDLSTMEIRQGNPFTDRHTRQTLVSPKHGDMPKFNAFLDMVITDPERIEYMQTLMGAVLIGEIRWHVLPVLVGVGANGKSTFLDIVGRILGDYTAIMPENFLLDSGRTEHPTEIARLRGVRLAIASETRPDGKFNEGRVKQLTAEPILTGRAMRKDFMDFKATHTLVLALNHLPEVRNGGDGFWRRLRLLDFKFQVPVERRNPNLAAEIVAEEGPQVLAWMIEGADRILREGLREPSSIAHATNHYRDEEDHISAFCTDRVDRSPESAHSSGEIYNCYTAWCKRNGQSPLPQAALFRELRSRYPMVPEKVGRNRGWKGIIVFVNED